MTRYRDALPQLSGELFLTDGGLETELIFREGFDLPLFAAIDLLRSHEGQAALRRYFRKYARIAETHGTGFILESATWRSSPDWGEKLGYGRGELDGLNEKAIDLLAEIREEVPGDGPPVVISGCVGPRGDGYDPSHRMSDEEAEAYHSAQIGLFAETDADQVSAITMNYVEEALGVAQAAAAAGMPSVISFTVETDGRLPTGQTLSDAIDQVDSEAGTAPAYYMINCAHPTHYEDALEAGAPWTRRIRGMRGNASKMSHAELDEAPELDDGDPEELGQDYRRILGVHGHINVLGGCCGTDHRHVEAIAGALLGQKV